ncbi:MAG: MATE family efflux transporter [Treponema sp.]|nr:MATE family efflux transporter [Treponema sp.]
MKDRINDSHFRKELIQVALPVTVQALTQSSLSLIDQIMIGRLGSEAISGIGLAGKFTSIYSVILAAIVTTAGILISQYFGAKNKKGINSSFFLLLYSSVIFGIFFFVFSVFFPVKIMAVYSKDVPTILEAASYLRWRAPGYFPIVGTMFISTMLRNMKKAKLPAVAGISSIIINTVLNWVLIFGIGIFPRLGSKGAALATSISQIFEMFVVLFLFIGESKRQNIHLKPIFHFSYVFITKVRNILLPILAGEFLWALGENMYAVIYGHLGTEPCAAMTLMYPIQGIATGALCGVANAAGIIVGNSLGSGDDEKAWKNAMSFVRLTLCAGVLIGIFVWVISPFYVRLFKVPLETRAVTIKILAAFSVIFTAKVFNMVIGGGVLQSGGQTKFLTLINIIGTWGFGVPLGFVSAFVFHFPIWWVYFMLSLEEIVRVLISIKLLFSRKWMKNVTVEEKLEAKLAAL